MTAQIISMAEWIAARERERCAQSEAAYQAIFPEVESARQALEDILKVMKEEKDQ